MSISLIWAQASNGVIGADGTMPWRLPEDLAHFRRLTTGSTVIMGRRTWESFPDRFRPLPDRRNVVLTRDPSWSASGAEVVHSIDDALALDASPWIIGGSQLFATTIDRASRLEVTEIDLAPEGDTYAPAIDFSVWKLTPLTADAPWLTAANGLRYRFVTYALV
ncbi:MAG TPA: dihydrofolate reductase [Pseudolysinimonas sp.]|nr:dihydrofolate reductase [Pseudolysinimonas sp.]